MTEEDIGRFLEQLASGDSKQILEILTGYLWNNIDAGDDKELDDIMYKWNSPKPVNTDVLKPFVESLIELTTYGMDDVFSDDYEIRMFATDFLCYTDERAIPALIAILEHQNAGMDMIEGALRGLVNFGAVESCDTIYNSISKMEPHMDFEQDGGLIALIHAPPHLVALGKLGDQRAFDLINRGLKDESYRDEAMDILIMINTPISQQILDKQDDYRPSPFLG